MNRNRVSNKSVRLKKYKSNVVFKDELNDSLHDLHKRIRDISFEQEKLNEKLNYDKEHEYIQKGTRRLENELDESVCFASFLK